MAGIYVHIPFCKRKCVYCGFFSVASSRWREAYWDALCAEIESRRDELAGTPVATLYFGGGTPSLCSPAELERIVAQLRRCYRWTDEVEFTLEANPEQLTADYLAALKSLGVNRLSIGVQSFDDEILRLLNRTHTAAQAREAVERAAQAGFDNLSIDLIYDIAYRTAGQWRTEVRTALALPIRHLSAYSLTVEENTLLARRVREGAAYLPDESDTARDFDILTEETAAAGFEQYEISNFAKEGAVSRHNAAYWTGEPYLGFGAAAHSYKAPVRRWNVADLKKYVEGAPPSPLPSQGWYESEVLTSEEQLEELVMLRLRTRAGLPLAEVEERFGRARRQALEARLRRVNPENYVLADGVLRLTHAGVLVADAVIAELMD